MAVLRYDAIYARQSIYKEDSLSIEMQIELAEKFCENPIRYYKDPGRSGKNTKRPDYIRLMKDIENDMIDRVVVYKLDRFTRSLLDFISAWEFMSKHQVQFISVTERFDTSTPIGEAMLMIMATFAQFERKQISSRVKDNYYARTIKGTWMGGPAPYGYDLVYHDDQYGRYKRVGVLESNDKIEIVKRIFDTYKAPLVSLGDIARELREEGIAAPNGSPVWQSMTVSRVLRNPAYVKMDASMYTFYKSLGVTIPDIEKFDAKRAGMVVGKNQRAVRIRNDCTNMKLALANWEGVIDSTVFLQCQYKLAQNKQCKKDGAGSHTWLSGLIKCEKCKRALVVCTLYRKYGGDQLYFRCSGKQAGICDSRHFPPIFEIEDNVADQLKEELAKVGDKNFRKPTYDNATERELIKIDEKIQNLMDVLTSETASNTTLQFVNIELEKLMKRQQELFNEQEKRVTVPAIPLIVDFDVLSFEEKKKVAFTYISKIYVDSESEKMRIVWKV